MGWIPNFIKNLTTPTEVVKFNPKLAKMDFNYLRNHLGNGSLTQSQVNGINAILAVWNSKYYDNPIEFLAYMFATAYHETDYTLQPIAEYGHGRGKKYGVPGKYNQVPYGRGYVQLTWDYNYERADKECGLNGTLCKNFDLALKPEIASRIMFEGMLHGWFVPGHYLARYFNDHVEDPVGARTIINGTDRASTIAGYYKVFKRALNG